MKFHHTILLALTLSFQSLSTTFAQDALTVSVNHLIVYLNGTISPGSITVTANNLTAGDDVYVELLTSCYAGKNRHLTPGSNSYTTPPAYHSGCIGQYCFRATYNGGTFGDPSDDCVIEFCETIQYCEERISPENPYSTYIYCYGFVSGNIKDDPGDPSLKSQPFEDDLQMATANMSLHSIRLVPNPFDEELTIELKAARPGELEAVLLNTLGQQVMRQKLNMHTGFNEFKLTTGDALPTGSYVLILKDRSGILRVVRLIRH